MNNKVYISWLGWFEKIFEPKNIQWDKPNNLQSNLINVFGEYRISKCKNYIKLTVISNNYNADDIETVICYCENGIPKGYTEMPSIHN